MNASGSTIFNPSAAQELSSNSESHLPYFLRTTLEERIEAVSGGCELIAITLLPRLLPLSYQTIKNQICANRFPLEIVHFNSKNYVRTEDAVRLIYKKGLASLHKKRGRKSNRERAAQRNLGTAA